MLRGAGERKSCRTQSTAIFVIALRWINRI
jgi:hypothetical protein